MADQINQMSSAREIDPNMVIREGEDAKNE
jgi:hypothetical protein